MSHVNWEHKAVVVVQTCLQLNCNVELADHSEGLYRIEWAEVTFVQMSFLQGFL